MAIDLTVEHGQGEQRSALVQENQRLRQELEHLKKLVKRYEEDLANGKKSKPGRIPETANIALPSLEDSLTQSPQTSSPTSVYDNEEQKTVGLYHRKHSFHEDEERNEGLTPRKRKDSFGILPDDPESGYDFEEGVSLLEKNQLKVDVGNVDGNDAEEMIMNFGKMIFDRAGWLVGLLVLQSMSSFIIQYNENLLQRHLVIVRFLTMLVGAGGNAGNQASVRVIRGLAIGSIKGDGVKRFLLNELAIGLCLSVILGVAGCIRAAVFLTPLSETIAITASLVMIVIISVILGATLPLGMRFVGIDPAHSSTTIQVLMDILGVTITVCVSGLILDSSLGVWMGLNPNS